jgi:hypothetical protein
MSHFPSAQLMRYGDSKPPDIKVGQENDHIKVRRENGFSEFSRQGSCENGPKWLSPISFVPGTHLMVGWPEPKEPLKPRHGGSKSCWSPAKYFQFPIGKFGSRKSILSATTPLGPQSLHGLSQTSSKIDFGLNWQLSSAVETFSISRHVRSYRKTICNPKSTIHEGHYPWMFPSLALILLFHIYWSTEATHVVPFSMPPRKIPDRWFT